MTPLVRAVRESENANGWTLVLLHGLGSNERDLLGLAPYLPDELRIICLRAPLPHGPGGFSWFEIDWSENGLTFSEADMRTSLAAIQSALAEFDPARLIIGGFSQGAVMSMLTASREGQALAGVVLLSGAPLVGSLIPDLPTLSETPALIQHGRFDEVLPLRLGQALAEQARALGATVDYHEYPMAHQIGEESLADLVSWLKQRMT